MIQFTKCAVLEVLLESMLISTATVSSFSLRVYRPLRLVNRYQCFAFTWRNFIFLFVSPLNRPCVELVTVVCKKGAILKNLVNSLYSSVNVTRFSTRWRRRRWSWCSNPLWRFTIAIRRTRVFWKFPEAFRQRRGSFGASDQEKLFSFGASDNLVATCAFKWKHIKSNVVWPATFLHAVSVVDISSWWRECTISKSIQHTH